MNAWAAPPTFDARTVSTCTGCSSNSFSHTIGGGCTNDIVIVDNLMGGGAPTITSVTVGGNATTPIASDTDFQSTGWSIDMQRKVGASTGANTVTANYSTSVDVTMFVRSYCGVDQTTPTGASSTDNHAPDGTNPSINVASALNDLVIDFAAGGDPDVNTWTVGGGGQAQRTNDASFAGAQTFLESDKAGAASTTNLSWSYGGANNLNLYWASIGVALKPVSTAAKPQIQVIVVE